VEGPVVVLQKVCGILTCAAILAAAGCGLLDNSTSPTTPEAPTEAFSGTLTLQGSSLFSFTVTQAGTIRVTLATLSPSPTAGVGLGIGTPSGTAGCTLTSSTPSATAGSAAQITVTANPGTYCVKVYDTGNLTATASFTINITHS
jgi:hypothetical protein